MPLVRIEYDNEKVTEEETRSLSNGVRDIVSEVTEIEDVFVYANSSQIKIKVAPIEVFVEMSAHKIKDADQLIGEIKSRLTEWKESNSFAHPLNLTLIPMNWKVEIGI
ncbi:hypothetical protein CL654_02990 [bacterium]|nr:hypothetical protein [bacterium]|tara:strand:+ start:3042 stop:3365 length:324 start_codon:yes stop_codon:yes gene_type:complete